MKLYNYELKLFIEFLYNLKLAGKASRMRTRFINLLNEKYQLFENERYQLIKEHANLNEEGNPKVIEVNGEMHWDIKDMDAYNKDFLELVNEEVVIDESESNKEMLLSIKESVLNCDLEFEKEEAVLYARFCDIVEQIQYE